jgi:hypothetical protein
MYERDRSITGAILTMIFLSQLILYKARNTLAYIAKTWMTKKHQVLQNRLQDPI